MAQTESFIPPPPHTIPEEFCFVSGHWNPPDGERLSDERLEELSNKSFVMSTDTGLVLGDGQLIRAASKLAKASTKVLKDVKQPLANKAKLVWKVPTRIDGTTKQTVYDFEGFHRTRDRTLNDKGRDKAYAVSRMVDTC